MTSRKEVKREAEDGDAKLAAGEGVAKDTGVESALNRIEKTGNDPTVESGLEEATMR